MREKEQKKAGWAILLHGAQQLTGTPEIKREKEVHPAKLAPPSGNK